MKKLTLLLGCVAAVGIMTGCTSFNTSDGASLMPQVSADHPGYEAKLSVGDKRIQGEATVNVLFGIFAWGTDGYADNTKLSTASPVALPLPVPVPVPELPTAEDFAKKASVYNVCEAKKVDTLVGSRYTIKTVDYFVFKIINCKVEGFPAKITGVTQKKPYITANGNLVWLAEQPAVVK